jgi:hypothetical protein
MTGIQTNLMNNANKFLNNAFQFYMLEPVKPSIEFNLLLLVKMVQLFIIHKRLNQNGTSKNSEIERMKDYGNDLIDCMVNSIFV